MNNYEIVWNIRYFLLAKSIKESENNEDSRCEGTSSK